MNWPLDPARIDIVSHVEWVGKVLAVRPAGGSVELVSSGSLLPIIRVAPTAHRRRPGNSLLESQGGLIQLSPSPTMS